MTQQAAGTRDEELDVLPFPLERGWKYHVGVDGSGTIIVFGDPKPNQARSRPKRLLELTAARHDAERHRGCTYIIVDGVVVRRTDLSLAEEEHADAVLTSPGVRALSQLIGKAIGSVWKRAFTRDEHPAGPFLQLRTADAVDVFVAVHAQRPPASISDVVGAAEIARAIAARAASAPARDRIGVAVDLDSGSVSADAEMQAGRRAALPAR